MVSLGDAGLPPASPIPEDEVSTPLEGSCNFSNNYGYLFVSPYIGSSGVLCELTSTPSSSQHTTSGTSQQHRREAVTARKRGLYLLCFGTLLTMEYFKK